MVREGKINRICFLSRRDIHTCCVLTERSKSMSNESDFDLGCILHVKVLGFLFPSKDFKHCGVREKSMAQLCLNLGLNMGLFSFSVREKQIGGSAKVWVVAKIL